ncbi:transketolase family protein [Hippea sp. KM1]|uniref:transketolase family protein n=1 Tax=Hippea sp. KM1 TaxID=944481 RepID=UPI00046CC3D2|nr:transketolase C-terminal domain-containing protein [Hippea sp. KM1]
MISLREAFGKYLLELARNRDDFFVLDADVAGGTFTHWFRDKYPERFVECGIAEQNMFGVAAGLSTLGIIPIVTTYAVFASMRAIEQARNSIAYPNFNVKIVASHPGIDTGPDGATHQAIEDLAIYRSIPNFVVLSPADDIELKQCLNCALDHKGPVYIRTGRSPVPTIHEEGYKFNLGNPDVIFEGEKDIILFGCGITSHRVLNVAKKLGITAVNVPTLKPINREDFVNVLKPAKIAITVEDHNIIGGLGDLIGSVISGNGLCTKLIKMGVQDKFGKSGDPIELAKLYGIDESSIENTAKEVINEIKG